MQKQIFDTQYEENYARLTLKYIYPKTHFNFICDDKPDIQNNVEKIGIEVTIATSEHEAISNAFFNKICGKNLSIKEITQLALKMYHCKNKEELPCYVNDGVFSPSKGLITPAAFLQNIINASKSKQAKMDNYNKESWKQIGLYLFTLMYFEEYEIISILPELVVSSDFDFYIINVLGDLYYIHKNAKYNKYIISDDDLKIFKKNA